MPKGQGLNLSAILSFGLLTGQEVASVTAFVNGEKCKTLKLRECLESKRKHLVFG